MGATRYDEAMSDQLLRLACGSKVHKELGNREPTGLQEEVVSSRLSAWRPADPLGRRASGGSSTAAATRSSAKSHRQES
jgi:hypothetical protein